jgi:hypothetical protein
VDETEENRDRGEQSDITASLLECIGTCIANQRCHPADCSGGLSHRRYVTAGSH